MSADMLFDFILKPVGQACNLACTYCYYLQQEKSASERQRWSVEFTHEVLTNIANFEHARGKTTASVTWHGGEPLLLGLDWYERIFEFQSTSPVKFKNSFQTNGLLLSADWCEFLKSNDITIGISLDGPAHVHNLHRVTRDGHGTFHQAFHAVELCQRYGVDYGILCVVTRESVPYCEEILDFFYTNGIRNFDFLPAYALSTRVGQPVLETNVPPSQFAQFMKAVFDWYLQKDDPDIRLRTIVSLIERLLGGEGSVCTMGGKSCGSFLTIDVNGIVAFCDDYNAEVFPSLGNISTFSVGDIVNGKAFAEARTKVLSRLEKCVDCNVKEICGGGCPRHWNNRRSYFCDYYRDFYPYAYERLRSILRPALIEKANCT